MSHLCSLSYLICFRAPIENDGLDGITNYHIVIGVFLLGCFIGLVALCLGSEVDPGQYIRIHHECKDGIEKYVTGLSVITRHRFFYPTLTQIIDSFSCSSLIAAFHIGKKT